MCDNVRVGYIQNEGDVHMSKKIELVEKHTQRTGEAMTLRICGVNQDTIDEIENAYGNETEYTIEHVSTPGGGAYIARVQGDVDDHDTFLACALLACDLNDVEANYVNTDDELIIMWQDEVTRRRAIYRT